jgi:hypothetical protein
MPTISRFYGIVIRMYFSDHALPHFHAVYSGEEAVIAIESGEVIRGGLPERALRLVREWREIHRDELVANWARVQVPDLPQRSNRSHEQPTHNRHPRRASFGALGSAVVWRWRRA